MHGAGTEKVTDQKLSPTIYSALVDSLFQNPAPMLAGAVCAGVAAVMTALKTGDPWLWPCASLLIIVGSLRAMDMGVYMRRKSELSVASASRWEVRYQVGAMFYALTLGVWCATCIVRSDDAIAHMICSTVTIGYIAAGAGRTYGRPWIFHLQVLLACGILTGALVWHGNPYYLGVALLNGLFFLGLKHITTSLQSIFVKALIAHENEAALAGQFDTALNNMPHGLCMFGPDGGLVVINHRFGEMMKLGGDFAPRGHRANDILSACIGVGTISEKGGRKIAAAIDRGHAGEIVTVDPHDPVGRAFSWTLQPMAGGGTVVLVEDITERRAAEARITHLAQFDELTALPNRVHFRDQIDRLLAFSEEEQQRAALLFIDLDQFKQVNDTLGHPCGDELLCAVATRLRMMLGPDHFVARFGGDEFVVFQQNLGPDSEAAALSRRIVERLSERYTLGNHVVEIGASIGIAIAIAGVNADTLIKQADMALYRAKAAGRGTFCFFREEMARTVETRRNLELDLRRALANEEFELYYQPLVNLKSGKISTCEALLRWNHPERGLVSPIDIIPVAEEMGLIIELGRWILQAACKECVNWPEQVSVAVNFSPQQFHQREVLGEVQEALEAANLPSQRLEIEITESSLLRNTQWTHDALAQLHAAGVRISLDDFGTGYSSLSYLHNFPLNKVKIDRSFLEGIDSARPLTLLRGVARLSADLGMSVVVEGIETNQQLDIIIADGTVTEVQGYLFSKPVPAARIRELLDASHGRHQDEAASSQLTHVA
jgi:diguanylate cyclase (GGDEF)-like protein